MSANPDEDVNVALLRQIESAWARSLRTFGESFEAAPFVCTFDPLNDLIWLNYALPVSHDASADDDAMLAAIDRLRPEFKRRRRKLRFEFHQELWPRLSRLLDRIGLSRSEALPVMACSRAEVRGESEAPGVRIEELAPDADERELRDHINLRDRSFGMETTADDAAVREQVDQFRDRLRQRKMKTLHAWIDGALVGAGSLLNPNEPVCELVGVVTHEAFRRRGIAKAISQRLACEALDRAAKVVWLSAGNDTARNVYERIGFRVIGTQLSCIEA